MPRFDIVNVYFLIGLLQIIATSDADLPPLRLIQPVQRISGTYSNKVVGGEAVQNCTDYPYQVSFQFKRTIGGESPHFCGGSILNKDYILTAGHCAKGLRLSSFFLVFAAHKLNATKGHEIQRNAVRYAVHKDYDSENFDYDVAVIKLDKSLDLEHECISPVNLPEQDEEIISGTLGVAAGFGATSESSALSNELRVVSVPVVKQEDCKATFGEEYITSRMLCAGFEDGGKDACQGDSGGPLTVDGKQIGITSWGYGCARPGFYGVYTRVAFFSKWIKDQIN